MVGQKKVHCALRQFIYNSQQVEDVFLERPGEGAKTHVQDKEQRQDAVAYLVMKRDIWQ
jgi:hypothetical protein